MDFATLTWIWLIAGLVLMFIELIIPGLVVVFLGLAAIFVSLGRFTRLIQGEVDSLIIWFILSIVLVLSLRWIALKLFPEETGYVLQERGSDAVVEVLETVYNGDISGRIKYEGTTWPAICHNGEIQPGKKVKLLYRDNLAWVVEAILEPDDIKP